MQDLNSATMLRVGVFFGGKSIEREVSLNSGRTICDHLDSGKYLVVPIFQDEDGTLYVLPWHFLHRGKISDFQWRLAGEAKKIEWDDLKNLVDFVYLAVHGRFAEDGTIQGMLEVLSIPYLGSKIFGSALGMNKLVQKDILKFNGIDVAKGIVIRRSECDSITTQGVIQRLNAVGVKLPCIVKPVHEGSSLGVSIIKEESDLIPSIQSAAHIDSHIIQDVIVEEKIEGMEFVCVCLQKAVKNNGKIDAEWFTFPITEVIPEGQTIYDYEQKYMPGRATKVTPARCSEVDSNAIKETCIKASKLLNFATISRIDGFLTKDGRVILIDPNTLTGMSPATFLFHQAAEFGMSHTQLINYLIETELKLAGMLEFENEKDLGGGFVSKENNTEKMRIAVLLGGSTNEREISLESGRNICYKLSPQKYDVIPLFVTDKYELFKLPQNLLIKNSTREIFSMLDNAEKILWAKLPEVCDFVFIGLHGGLGEGGGVQGVLEMLGLPYNGSGVLPSALCMDKFKTNNFLRTQGFDVPSSFIISYKDWQNKNETEKLELFNYKFNGIEFPVILKPHDDGCSVFVKKISSINDVINYIDEYFITSGKSFAMIEEMVNGTELTCGVIGNGQDVKALIPSMVVAKKGILSIEEKFLPGEGENQTPAQISEDAISLVRIVMENAYKTIGCAGYARIDCFYQDAQQSPNEKPRVIILEFNTLPGMTPATCIFHQAAECGMRPMEFIDKIVEFGLTNHAEKIKRKFNLKSDSLDLKTSSAGVVSLHKESEPVEEKYHKRKIKSGRGLSAEASDQADSSQVQGFDDQLTMKLF